MGKVIDSFLFFKELDLLEIRLKYLDPLVDQFVILEACQTFTGKPKSYVFEENKERFRPYLHKIHHVKVEDSHEDYASVKTFLEKQDDPSLRKVLTIMENHQHYPKSVLHWVLDSYHRERLHCGLDAVCSEGDIVFMSDLDEIPSHKMFKPEIIDLAHQAPRICLQKEFRYFMNYFKGDEWLGTIIGTPDHFKNQSLNEMKQDSKEIRKIVHKEALEDGGYHFTTCGGLEMIKDKIESWGHQEFNTSSVMKNLAENIRSGQDIFQRESGTNLLKVDLNDTGYLDPGISKIIREYPHLVTDAAIDARKPSPMAELRIFMTRVFRKIGSILKD